MASHKVYRSEEIHDNKAHSSIQSYHINNGEKLRQGKEDKVLHQDDSCDSRNEYDHKDWDEYMDEDILGSLFHNVQEALDAYDHNCKSLHQMLPLNMAHIFLYDTCFDTDAFHMIMSCYNYEGNRARTLFPFYSFR